MNKKEMFNSIVAENSEKIRRICSYYNSDPEDHKDMYQEVLINIWKSLDSFRGEAKLSTWIYRVAVNTSLTFTGKRFQRMKLLVNFNTEKLDSILDDDNGIEKQLHENQLKRLQNELNQLAVIDKALMSLLLEGLSMREIADVIGISESNVKVKIHRVKSHLKETLKKESDENM